MDQINQLSDFNQAQDDEDVASVVQHHQLSNDNVHPDLHPNSAHQISTAPGRYNPYPVHFQRTDGQPDLTEDDVVQNIGSPSNGLDHTNGGLLGGSNGGRSSIMLGEDGMPIPEEEKPPQGTEEWNRMRRINHKEVERKRRQTINEGIDELARLIANPHQAAEKNKGSVLQKACLYINELKNNTNANIEKYTMEKLLCDQTIAELQAANQALLQSLQDQQQRGDLWKATAQGDESAREQAEAMDG